MTAKRPPGRPPRGKKASLVQFTIRLTEPEVTRYQREADKQGLTLSQWTREAMELAYARGASR